MYCVDIIDYGNLILVIDTKVGPKSNRIVTQNMALT